MSGYVELSRSDVQLKSLTKPSSTKPCHSPPLKYLSQAEAIQLDQELFTEYKFSVDQLMELAGLSVASAVAKQYPAFTYPNVLIICGPGNNGGDGLVAARHLTMFGYNATVYYPKRTAKPLYENLFEQCVKYGVEIIQGLPDMDLLHSDYQVIVDALFGFSFKPPAKQPLKSVLDVLINVKTPVCSVDIPSGWDVEKGPPSIQSLKPAMLISLSAPKLCAQPSFLEDTIHYVGGRFLPPGIIEKYKINLPPYPAQEQIIRLSC